MRNLTAISMSSVLLITTLTAPSLYAGTPDLDAPAKPRLKTQAKSGITRIRGTFNWDIESDKQGRSPAADVWWQQVGATERYLKLSNGALFADTGNTPYEQLTADDLGKCTFAPNKLDGSNENPVLKPGFTFGLRTTEGNLAKCRVKAIHPGRQLELEWTLYEESPIAADAPAVKADQTSPKRPAKNLRRYTGIWQHAVQSGPIEKTLVLSGFLDDAGHLKFKFLEQHFSYLPVFQKCTVDKDQVRIYFKLTNYYDGGDTDHTITYMLTRDNKDLKGQFVQSWQKPAPVVLKPVNLAAALKILGDSSDRTNRVRSAAAEREAAYRRQVQEYKNRIAALENAMAQSRAQHEKMHRQFEETRRLLQQAKEKTAVLMDEIARSLQQISR